MPISSLKPNLALPAALFVLIAVLGLDRSAELVPATSQSDSKGTAEPARTLELDLGDEVRIRFVQIPAGKFLMGSPKDEKDRLDNEGPQRQVTVSKPLYLGVYPVTQEQYEAVMGKNPSTLKGAGKPVETVNWYDAVAFCRRASAKTGKRFRLPTEAEWEYACRAGSRTRYFFGDDEEELGDYAWFRGNSNGSTHAVGHKKPNAWGLYDIVGNVGQWCQDLYTGPFPSGTKGPKRQNLRTFRGGFWDLGPAELRCARRFWSMPGARNFYVGFRVIVSSQSPPGNPAVEFLTQGCFLSRNRRCANRCTPFFQSWPVVTRAKMNAAAHLLQVLIFVAVDVPLPQLDVRGLLLEQLRCKLVKIVAPVDPCVGTLGFLVDYVESVLLEQFNRRL